MLSNFKSANSKDVIVGFGDCDDAAVVRLDDKRLLVQTVDFFTPIVDDPYQFGQIAAANSLSDIYAMGAKPTFALNIFAFPINDIPKQVASQILEGGANKAEEAGIPILGGHSIDDKEPKYGLVVTGEIDESSLIKNSGAKPKDLLILTKPLGSGIVSTAIKKDLASKTIEA
ncbi:MAG: selenide, water dikinase SelD, partial [Candidatus Neomarinimicrobiota bacterium]|nr:selenide, water dikinase SelD [Candidatus Neomarinimicrobiota bacterium]